MSQQIGDLISREDTLTAFSDYVGRGMSMDDFGALWDIVAKMPPVNPQGPKWIPISEGLPQLDVEVWVTDDAGGLATISTDSMYENEVTGEKEWYTSQNVTAWMPLPEPYKGR